MVKNLPANEGDIRDAASIPGSGRSLGEGNGNPVQCSRLGNPMDRGASWATVHGDAKSHTTEQLSTQAQSISQRRNQTPGQKEMLSMS